MPSATDTFERTAALPAAPVSGLPGRCYTDPELAARERETILHANWQVVCHLSDLPAAGTAVRFDCAGRSAVVLRGRDGAVRAFLNVCSHRGSRIVDGDPHTGLAFCVDARLRCPYHGWTYDDGGALVDVPRESAYSGLDRNALPLRSLPVETWLGWVFVAFERPRRDVAAMLSECAADLQPHRLEALRRCGDPRVRSIRADWKTVCEHLLDGGHLPVSRPSLKAVVGHGRTCTTLGDAVMRIAVEITGVGSSNWSSRAYSRWLPDDSTLPADRRRRAYCYFIWPNVALHVYPDQVVLEQVLPGGAGACALRETRYALPDAARQMRLARYVNQRVQREARRDDMRLAERVQAGRETGDYVPGPISADEPGLIWFTRSVLAVMPDTAEPASQLRGRRGARTPRRGREPRGAS